MSHICSHLVAERITTKPVTYAATEILRLQSLGCSCIRVVALRTLPFPICINLVTEEGRSISKNRCLKVQRTWEHIRLATSAKVPLRVEARWGGEEAVLHKSTRQSRNRCFYVLIL